MSARTTRRLAEFGAGVLLAALLIHFGPMSAAIGVGLVLFTVYACEAKAVELCDDPAAAASRTEENAP